MRHCLDWLSEEPLLQTAPTVAGIYSDHLRHHLTFLQEQPELAAYKQIITAALALRGDRRL